MREHEQDNTLGIAVHTGTRSRSHRVALTTNIVLESYVAVAYPSL